MALHLEMPSAGIVSFPSKNGRVEIEPSAPWYSWFSLVSQVLTCLVMSGTTAQRPVKFLWIGRPYFDVTLGIPIWLQSTPPDVWVDATGAPV